MAIQDEQNMWQAICDMANQGNTAACKLLYLEYPKWFDTTCDELHPPYRIQYSGNHYVVELGGSAGLSGHDSTLFNQGASSIPELRELTLPVLMVHLAQVTSRQLALMQAIAQIDALGPSEKLGPGELPKGFENSSS